MSEIVDIEDIRKKTIKKQECRMLDIRASYTTLEQCYRYLGMNNLPEIKQLKSDIQSKMLELRKLMNGKK